MKFIVGCDADGVLTNLSEHNLREGKKAFGRDPKDVSAYSLEEMYDLTDLSKTTMYSKAFRIYFNYCNNEPPRGFVSEAINKLSSNDTEFHSITARKFATKSGPLGNLARKMYIHWLKKHDINFSSLQFCSEENSPRDKYLACRRLDVDVMIEDKPDVALFLAENGIKVILVDAPYNRMLEHNNIIRVNDWHEVYAKLFQMKEEKLSLEKQEFKRLSKDEICELGSSEKQDYYERYKSHLKGVSINIDKLRKGANKFKLIYKSLKGPMKIAYNIQTFGKENVPYQNGIIIASNHCDSTDQYKIGLALGNRPFVGFAAKEIEKSFRGRLFSSTGLGIFMDRADPVNRQESSELMGVYIVNGIDALIFPEGTRKNKDEEGKNKFQNPFKLGTVSLAQKTKTAILPTAISTFGRDVLIRFGEITYIDPTDDLENENRKLALTIAKMSLENYRYYYGKKGMVDELQVIEEKYKEYLKMIGVDDDNVVVDANKGVRVYENRI